MKEILTTSKFYKPMDRKELYAKVKEYNLQETIKEECGENYTRVSNDKLEEIIADYEEDCPDSYVDEEEEEENSCGKEGVNVQNNIFDSYEAACLTFLGILKDTGKLDSLLERL